MGHYEPRTAADETADALAALADARRALHDLSSHLDDLDNTDGAVHQARRNARIAAAKLAEAEQHVREGNRVQLTVVS
jgi:predicted component of type VI protein secretion system